MNPVLVVFGAFCTCLLPIYYFSQFAVLFGPPLGQSLLPTISAVVTYMVYNLIRYLHTLDRHFNSVVCICTTYSEQLICLVSFLYCLTVARKYIPVIPIASVQFLFLIFFAGVTLINC